MSVFLSVCLSISLIYCFYFVACLYHSSQYFLPLPLFLCLFSFFFFTTVFCYGLFLCLAVCLGALIAVNYWWLISSSQTHKNPLKPHVLQQIKGFHALAWHQISGFVCLHVYGCGYIYACLCALLLCHFICLCACAPAYQNVCACLCLGEDTQHGAGQGLRRGSGSGRSVAADPTVRALSVSGGFFSIICNIQYRNFILVDQT